MTQQKQLMENNVEIFPITHVQCVLDNNGENIGNKIKNQPTDLSLSGSTLKLKKADGTTIGTGVVLPSSEDSHIHNNKGVLDGVTQEKIIQWDSNSGGSSTIIIDLLTEGIVLYDEKPVLSDGMLVPVEASPSHKRRITESENPELYAEMVLLTTKHNEDGTNNSTKLREILLRYYNTGYRNIIFKNTGKYIPLSLIERTHNYRSWEAVILQNLNNFTIDFGGNNFVLVPSVEKAYSVFNFEYCSNLKMKNCIVEGNRYYWDYKDRATSPYEGGYGVIISSCDQVQVNNVESLYHIGDGIYTGYNYPSKVNSTSISDLNFVNGSINSTGEIVSSSSSIICNKVDISKFVNELSDSFKDNFLMLHGNANYNFGALKPFSSRLSKYHFYRADNTFISSVSGLICGRIDIPKGSKYVVFEIIQSQIPDNLTISINNILPNKNVSINNCFLHHNRRQGISICGGNSTKVFQTEISHISGVAPQCGVDIEDGNLLTSNVVIEECIVHDCGHIGLLTFDGEYNKFLNNICYNNIGGDAGITYSKNTIVVGNTFSSKTGMNYLGGAIQCDNNIFENSRVSLDISTFGNVFRDAWLQGNGTHYNSKIIITENARPEGISGKFIDPSLDVVPMKLKLYGSLIFDKKTNVPPLPVSSNLYIKNGICKWKDYECITIGEVAGDFDYKFEDCELELKKISMYTPQLKLSIKNSICKLFEVARFDASIYTLGGTKCSFIIDNSTVLVESNVVKYVIGNMGNSYYSITNSKIGFTDTSTGVERKLGGSYPELDRIIDTELLNLTAEPNILNIRRNL